MHGHKSRRPRLCNDECRTTHLYIKKIDLDVLGIDIRFVFSPVDKVAIFCPVNGLNRFRPQWMMTDRLD